MNAEMETHKDNQGYAVVRMVDVVSLLDVFVQVSKSDGIPCEALENFQRLFQMSQQEVQMAFDVEFTGDGCGFPAKDQRFHNLGTFYTS